MVQSFLKETALRTWLCRTTFMETIFHAPSCGVMPRSAVYSLTRVWMCPQCSMVPATCQVTRSTKPPSALSAAGFRLGDFDLLDAGDRPALFLHDQALLDLQVQVGQQVAGDALGQGVVDIGFAAIVEAAIDVAQQRLGQGGAGRVVGSALPGGNGVDLRQRRSAGTVPRERRLFRREREAGAFVVGEDDRANCRGLVAEAASTSTATCRGAPLVE